MSATSINEPGSGSVIESYYCQSSSSEATVRMARAPLRELQREFSSCTVIHCVPDISHTIQELEMALDEIETSVKNGINYAECVCDLASTLETLRRRSKDTGWMSGYIGRICTILTSDKSQSLNSILLINQTCLWLTHALATVLVGSSAYVALVGIMVPTLIALNTPMTQTTLTFLFANIRVSRYLVEQLVRMRVDNGGQQFYSSEFAAMRRARVVWLNFVICKLPEDNYSEMQQICYGELDEVLQCEQDFAVRGSFFRYPSEACTRAKVTQLMGLTLDIPAALHEDLMQQLCKREFFEGNSMAECNLQKKSVNMRKKSVFKTMMRRTVRRARLRLARSIPSVY